MMSIAQDTGNTPSAFPTDLLDWVGDNIYPIPSVEPERFETELTFLDEIISDKHVVLLGEGTHGTKEIFQIKDKMVRYLMQELAFNKLGIEYDLIDGLLMNRFVGGEDIDLTQALDQQRGWVWNTREIEAVVTWMRKFNQQGGQVEFYGIDMFNILESLDVAIRYLESMEIAEIGFIEDQWEILFGRSVSLFLHLHDEDEFYDLIDKSDLSLSYRLVELMTILVEIYDQNQALLLRKDQPENWQLHRQLAVTALNRSQHLLQFNLQHIFAKENWQDEYDFYQSYPQKVDTILNTLQELKDTSLQDYLYPILEATENPYRGRRLFLTSLNFQERSDWLDALERSKARIQLKKVSYASHSDEDAPDRLLRLLDDVERLLNTYTAYFNKPIERINAREIGLADNAMFLESLDEQGTIIWAHNLHVSKVQTNTRSDGDKMGTFLKQRYGDSLIVIGTLFGTGDVQAWDLSGDKRKLNVFEVAPPEPGSIEDLFIQAGCEICLLDLRKIPESGPVHDWFFNQQKFRSIGNYYDPNSLDDFIKEEIIPEHFDILVFIRETNRAEPTISIRKKYFGE